MSVYSICMFICTAVFFYGPQFSTASNNETDRLALLQFKAGVTDDPLGILSSWNDSFHFCEWRGVHCGLRNLSVRVLDLSSSRLTGTISPYVGNLTYLLALYLNNNSFTGTISAEIGRLSLLKYLHLGGNPITGVIPSNISGCTSLTMLELADTRLTGEIPSELGSLPHLEMLSLGSNFTGLVPSFLGNLSTLSQMYLSKNSFYGAIPESLGKLKNLTILALAQNNLSGEVPPSIFNLSSLTILDLGNNKLGGKLPQDLGTTLQFLTFLSISTNNFTGLIPLSISNSSNLEDLQLSGNSLQGQVPSLQKLKKLRRLVLPHNLLGYGQTTDLDFISTLPNATMLIEFDISNNNFAGFFPKTICNFSMVTYLQFEVNKIAGKIPSCIGNLVSIQGLSFMGNQLSGFIPEEIGKLSPVNRLDLSRNNLSGSIPSSMGNLTQLTILYMSENNLEGNIPITLGKCTKLQNLNLSLNHLSGSIPSQLLSISALSIALDLHSNRLSGSLPAEVGRMTNLDSLDLSENMLSGVLPGTLGSSCIGLETLNLSYNHFQGDVLDSLQQLRGLRWLDLSHNKFSGKIPNFLVTFQFENLNLSHNYFEGEVPTGGVFSNMTIVSVIGNTKLCGGIAMFKLRQCDFNSNQSRKSASQIRRIIIGAVCGFVGVLLLLGCVLKYASRRIRTTRMLRRTEIPGYVGYVDNFSIVSYQDLHKATNGFAPENILGKGNSGTVYKGALDLYDGAMVAIKVFNLEQYGASKSFMAECRVLRNTRHRNLAKIITACSSVDYQGNDFKALVYEFMANGNLDEWLHQNVHKDPKQTLSYLQRLDIVVDVASSLNYLHHHCDTPIVHCDLKPSNVLLDDEMVARVSDFGLAKLLSRDIFDSYGNQISSVGVKGTVGYTPPEYGLGNNVSTNGDVYSFGILLLEMFTGKRPTDGMLKEGKSLHEYVKTALSTDKLTEVLDPAILEDIVADEPNSSTITKAMNYILVVGLSCSVYFPRERPDMTVIATRLSSVRNNLLPVNSPKLEAESTSAALLDTAS